MKKITFATLTLSVFITVFGFSQSNTMIFKKGSWSSKYIYGASELSLSEAGEKFKSECPEAYSVLKNARVAYGFGNVMSVVGGGMMGWELGNWISKKNVNGTVVGVGAGIAVISIILDASATKNFKKAADLYNNNKKTTSILNRFELNLTEANSVGLAFNF